MTPIEKLGQAITDALDEAPAADVLTIITGAFVGLTLEVVRRAGHDTGEAITVDGGKERDITVHAPKAVAAAGEMDQPTTEAEQIAMRRLHR